MPQMKKVGKGHDVPPASAEHMAEKNRIWAEREVERLAAEEAKYAAMEFDAPRPQGVARPGFDALSKHEKLMSDEEKAEQQEQIALLLANRITRTQKRIEDLESHGDHEGAARETVLLNRMKRRANDLQDSAAAVRHDQAQKQAGGDDREHPAKPSGSESQ